MSSTSDEIKTSAIKSLPNSIDGNGSSFIDKLKKVLVQFGISVADNAGTGTTVTHIKELTLTETTTTSGSTTTKNIYVQFNVEEIKKYKLSRIWFRKSSDGDFTMDGTTTTSEYTIRGVESGTTYYVKVAAVDENDNVAEFSTAPVASITISQGSSSNPNPPTNLVVTWKNGVPTWSWRASTTPGSSTCFYELRADANTGQLTNLMATVYWESEKEDYSVSASPPSGMDVGTVYLYFRNAYGVYSTALKKDFTVPGTIRPNPPRFEKTENGFLILMDDFTELVNNATVEVTDPDGDVETYTTTTNVKQIIAVSGHYKARYRFNTTTTAGEWSESNGFYMDLIPVIESLDGSVIINGTVAGSKIIDGAITAAKTTLAAISSTDGTLNANTVGTSQLSSGAVTAAKTSITAIDSSTGNLTANSVTTNTIAAGAVSATAIATNAITSDKILANAVTSDKILAGAVTAGKIDTNAVTADKINAGAVTTDKLDAGAVTAAKIAANCITSTQINAESIWASVVAAGAVSATKIAASQLSGNVITLSDNQGIGGGTVTLNANGMTCTMGNGSKIQFNTSGMSLVDSNGVIFSQICRFAAGTCSNDEYVSLGWDVAPKIVLLFPWQVMTMIQGYTSVNLYVVCEPSGITSAGFTAKVYTALAAGSYTDITAPAVTLTGEKRYEPSGPYNDYTPYATVSGITSNTDEVNLTIDCSFTVDGDGGRILIYQLDIYLEFYANDSLVANLSYYSLTNTWVNSGWTFSIRATPTVAISAGASVKYRWRIYHHDYPDASGWSHVSYNASSAASTGQARVSSPTKATGGDGTAHYLALG